MNEKIKLYLIEDYFLTKISYIKHFEQNEDFDLLGSFATAEECLEAMETTPVDVVLVDLGLPRMNGIEATRIFSEKYPETKCIILTSHEKDEEVMACLACGAKGYVLKDLPLANLNDVIKIVYLGGYWFDSKIEHIPLNAIPVPSSTEFNKLYGDRKELSSLTDREKEVLRLLIKGKTNPEIAKELFISANTAKAHVCNIITKLNVSDRVQAAVKALQLNFM